MDIIGNIRILLVEDDMNLGGFLKSYLEMKGYPADWVQNGEDGLRAFRTGKYNFCITDVMMPIMDGYTMAREIRAQDKRIPILFLTAKSLEEDRLTGFKIGADDYITKPFSMDELLLRVQAIWRRFEALEMEDPQHEFTIGNLKFDYQNMLLTLSNGKVQKLTQREADLLKILILHHNQVVERDEILNKIWKSTDVPSLRSMDVYLSKLRKILKGEPELELQNVHGVGFSLRTNKLK